MEKNKIQFWQLGMASFSYDIEYLPGGKKTILPVCSRERPVP